MKTMLTLALATVAGMAMAGDSCCKKKVSADEAFLQEANRMMVAAEGKKACCQTTAEKVVVKGEKGCCNAKEAPKPFKVFVADQGYQYFGCEGSAKEGREALVAKGLKVGKVQKAAVNR